MKQECLLEIDFLVDTLDRVEFGKDHGISIDALYGPLMSDN